MKRRREMEKGLTEIRSAIEELTLMVKLKPAVAVKAKVLDNNDGKADEDDDDGAPGPGDIPTRPFLSLCNLILQVLDKIGPTMAVLRHDIYQNIQRLELAYESEPSKNSNIAEIIKKEVREGISRKNNSCSKALVWLTRSLDFTVALLQRLGVDSGQSMEQAVEESYVLTLKPWHGWISSAAFRVALKLMPDNKSFIDLLSGKCESRDTFKEEIEAMVSLLAPFLEEVHATLKIFSLDRIKST